MRFSALYLALAVFICLAGASQIQAQVVGQAYRLNDKEVERILTRIENQTKTFRKSLDSSLDRSRLNGTNREDRINEEVHQFRRAAGDLKSRVGNGRDLNRSADQARRVLDEAQQVNRMARPRWFDNRLASEWSGIEQELRFISDVYGLRYNGGNGGYGDYRRDDDYRRNDRNRDRNNDWWRRIPLPQ